MVFAITKQLLKINNNYKYWNRVKTNPIDRLFLFIPRKYSIDLGPKLGKKRLEEFPLYSFLYSCENLFFFKYDLI